MKCFTHPQSDAVAVCTNCGKALCPACVMTSESGKIACSTTCVTALSQIEQTLQMVRGRGTKSYRVIAYFVWATAALIFGPITFICIREEVWPLVILLVPTIVIFITLGFVCRKLGAKPMLGQKEPN